LRFYAAKIMLFSRFLKIYLAVFPEIFNFFLPAVLGKFGTCKDFLFRKVVEIEGNVIE